MTDDHMDNLKGQIRAFPPAQQATQQARGLAPKLLDNQPPTKGATTTAVSRTEEIQRKTAKTGPVFESATPTQRNDTKHIANRRAKSLSQLFEQHDGKVSDRWPLYLTEYERLFAPYRNRPIRILEIGVQNGGSLELWAKYFPKATKIVGCDINQDCAQLQYDDPRISIIVGDANEQRTLNRVLEHCDCFDIIIDDGSHQSKDIICSFAMYFPYLRNDGLYIAEDLHCSYWKDFMGGLYHPGSAIAFFKLLVDIINREHWGIDKARSEILDHFEQCYGLDLTERSLRKIHSLQFTNSLCIVKKSEDQSNLLGPRLVAGISDVIAPMRSSNGTQLVQSDQRNNRWALSQSVDELTSLRAETLEGELAASNKQVVEKEVALLRLAGERDALARAAQEAAAARAEETRRLSGELAALQQVVDAQTRAAEAAAAARAEETQRLNGELAALQQVVDEQTRAAEAAGPARAEETQRLQSELAKLQDVVDAQTRAAIEAADARAKEGSKFASNEQMLVDTRARLVKIEAQLSERFHEIATLTRLLRESERAASRAQDKADWIRKMAVALLPGRMSLAIVIALMKIQLKRRGLFDCNAYLREHPDVARAGVDPLLHYIKYGIAEGRSRG